MGKAKRLVLNLIAFIFTSFLALKFLAALALLYLLGKIPLQVCESLRNITNQLSVPVNIQKDPKNNFDNTNQKENRQNLEDCFQSIIDSCISLCLTATFINYNRLLARGTLIICHNVHHSFLSFVYDGLPDYTREIQDSYNAFLIWGFILCGLFGVTTQLAFVMDLVSVLTLPTKMIYTLLRWLYSKSLALIGKLYKFIGIDEEKWITCPYPEKWLTSNYRTAGLMLLIVLGQVTVFVAFYYLWLCLVIVALSVIHNVLSNLLALFSLLGCGFCWVKRYEPLKRKTEIRQMFCPVLEPETAIRVLKGTNVFEKAKTQTNEQQKFIKSFSFISMFSLFSTLQKDHRLQQKYVENR